MEDGAVYSEGEVNTGLRRWLETVCSGLSLDVVTLRRELIDHTYLVRDDSGRHYSPGPGSSRWRFADDVATVDPAAVIAEALAQRSARRLEWAGGQGA